MKRYAAHREDISRKSFLIPRKQARCC